MTTHDKRRGRQSPSPTIRVSIQDLLKSKVSMLGDAMLPAGYGQIENEDDVREKLDPPADPRIARVTIIWDNALDHFPLEEVLDRMRETGAAMITSVEEVKS